MLQYSTVVPKPILSFCCIPVGPLEQAASHYSNLLPISWSLVSHNTCNTGTSVQVRSSNRTGVQQLPPPPLPKKSGTMCSPLHRLAVTACSDPQYHKDHRRNSTAQACWSQWKDFNQSSSQCQLLQRFIFISPFFFFFELLLYKIQSSTK